MFGDTLIWQPGSGSWKLAAPVFLEAGEELILYGVKSPRRFGFALRTRRKELIRRWDFRRHTNPDGEVLTGPHKHYWTPEYGEDMAYAVDDVRERPRLTLIKTCSTRNRTYARRLATDVAFGYADLARAGVDFEGITVVDDDQDVWERRN